MRVLRKLASCLEILIFLGGVPFWVLEQQNYVLRRGLLIVAGMYVVIRLWNNISWRVLFASPPPGWWKWPLVRASLACLLIFSFVFLFEPGSLFNLPRDYFWTWAVFIVLYPVLSVLPQELIFRVYVFEVHKDFLSPPIAAIIVSSIAFAWVHIIFAGWLAVAASFVAGIALAWNYQQNRYAPGAIWPLILEHSLYGQLVFTLGLYQYFFVPR